MSEVSESFSGKWTTVGHTNAVIDTPIMYFNQAGSKASQRIFTRKNKTRRDERTLSANNAKPKSMETWELGAPSDFHTERLVSAEIVYDLDGVAHCAKVFGLHDKYWVPSGAADIMDIGGDLT